MADAHPLSFAAFPAFNHLAPWQWVFLVTGLPGMVFAFFIFVVPREKKQSGTLTPKTTGGGLRGFMRANRTFLIYHFTGFGMLSIMVHGAAAWAPTYLTRLHGIAIKDIGFFVGLLVIPLGVGGAIVAGWLVDRSFKKGNRAAHLSHFAFRCLLITIAGGAGFLFDAPLLFTVVCFGIIQFTQPFSGVAGASLQISTPEQYRGRISGIFIMFYNAIGMMLGPGFVAFLSDQFGARGLGPAMALNYMLFGSLAAILLWKGRHFAAAATQNV
jgi:MFS family permease